MTRQRLPPLLIIIAVIGCAFWLGRQTAPPTITAAPSSTWLEDFDPSVPLFYRPWDKLISTNPKQIAAVRTFIAGLENNDAAQLIEAKTRFEEIALRASPDGEVHAYLWLVEYLLSTPGPARDALNADKNGQRIIQYFGGEEMPLLPSYLKRKHGLSPPGHRNELSFLDELIRFLNPTRDALEHTTKVLDAIGLKPGDSISDVGAGPGFFTWAFAERVGENGRVHPTELDHNHLKFLETVVRNENLKNVQVHRTNGSTIDVPADSLDHVFMSATFQAIYCCTTSKVRELLMSDVRTALKTDGRLTILENTPSPSDAKPARGTLMAAPLTILFVTANGFELVDSFSFTPHRVGLIFEKVENPE